MLKRCIMIFPKFSNMGIIDEIRRKYDPLESHVKPHITLVFPFKNNITYSEIRNHIENVLSSIKPFSLKLKGIKPFRYNGNYLFLNINKGNDEIIEISKKLYTGVLEQYIPNWFKLVSYQPHMTVGKIEKEDEYLLAIEDTKRITESFETIVDMLSVEIIDENEDSLIEMEIELKMEVLC